MNKTGIALLLSGALLLGCVRHPEIPVREFFKNPDSCAYLLSPSGKQISFLKPAGKSGRLNLFVQLIAGGEAKCVTSEEDRDVWAKYFWKDDDHIVYFIHLVGDCTGEWHIKCLDLKSNGNQAQDRTPPGFSTIIDQLPRIPDKILIGVGGNACRLNILSGQIELCETNPGDVVQWITDQNGDIRAAIAGDSVNLRLLSRPSPQGKFTTILNMDFRESIFPISYNFGEGEQLVPFRFVSGTAAPAFLSALAKKEAPANKEVQAKEERLYALSNMNGGKCRDKFALVQIDPETGSEKEESYANPDFDVNDIEVSRNRGVVSAKFSTWRNERYCLDDATKSIYDQLERHFRNDDVAIVAYSDDETEVIVERSSDQNPGESYLFKPGTGDLKKLGEYAPQLKGHLAPIEPICFISRDRRTINGYLTLPLGFKHTNLPLVVVPHGGPGWRNVWGFNRENREVQFFANRGYAVLQINFRGSIGYGREFWTSGFKQWGQAMQSDVTDGVLWAIQQKIADPKRIAIVGESYGGYAALAGIAFTKEVHYAAAVDRAGVSDLPTLFVEYPKLAQLRVKIGDPNQDSEMLKDFSPALHCDRIKTSKTPLFIAQGKYDRQVFPEQSTKLCDGLEKQGIKQEVLWLAEGHIFENEENLVAYYEAVDAFLKRHLR